MRAPDCARVEYGPNLLEFPTVEELLSFAREQGAESVSYRVVWRLGATS